MDQGRSPFADMQHATLRWWMRPLLWFLPTRTLSDQNVTIHTKAWRGRLFIVKEVWARGTTIKRTAP